MEQDDIGHAGNDKGTRQTGRPLFVSKVGDSEWCLNAQLHVRPEDWDAYAKGYRNAGDIVVQHVIAKKGWDAALLSELSKGGPQQL